MPCPYTIEGQTDMRDHVSRDQWEQWSTQYGLCRMVGTCNRMEGDEVCRGTCKSLPGLVQHCKRQTDLKTLQASRSDDEEDSDEADMNAAQRSA